MTFGPWQESITPFSPPSSRKPTLLPLYISSILDLREELTLERRWGEAGFPRKRNDTRR
jgi:hypothetical protein